MKQLPILCILALLCFSPALGGCSATKTPVRADLLHRSFELVSADGKAVTGTPRKPDLAFDEEFRIAGGICNRFVGQAELNGTILTVRQMASTRMLCPDETLNQLEHTFASMLTQGATLNLTGETLTLRQGGHTLVYTVQKQAQAQ